MNFLDDIEQQEEQQEHNKALGYVPSVEDLQRYFRNARIQTVSGPKFQPLIGEEKNALALFMAFVMARQGAVLKSLAGAGKTVLMDTVWSLVPPQRGHLIDMTSGLGIWAEAPALNDATFWFVPELQNSADGAETTKVLKKVGEGKEARRVRTDVTQREADGNFGTTENVIWPKPFITSFAIENDTAKGIYNDEVSRRVIELTTDISEEQTRRIIEGQLRMAEVGQEGICTMDDEEVDLMIRHVEQSITAHDEVTRFAFPGAGAMSLGIPATFVDSRSSLKILMSVVKGFALWNHKRRIIHDGVLFITPEDLFCAMEVYGETFIYKSLRVDLMAEPILKIIPDAIWAGQRIHDTSLMTVTQIVQRLKAMKVGISKKKVQSIMDSLEDNGLVEQHNDGVMDENQYYKTGLSTFDTLMDYKAIYARSEQVMKESYPTLAEDYKKNHLLSKIMTNPVTGETQEIY